MSLELALQSTYDSICLTLGWLESMTSLMADLNAIIARYAERPPMRWGDICNGVLDKAKLEAKRRYAKPGIRYQVWSELNCGLSYPVWTVELERDVHSLSPCSLLFLNPNAPDSGSIEIDSIGIFLRGLYRRSERSDSEKILVLTFVADTDAHALHMCCNGQWDFNVVKGRVGYNGQWDFNVHVKGQNQKREKDAKAEMNIAPELKSERSNFDLGSMVFSVGGETHVRIVPTVFHWGEFLTARAACLGAETMDATLSPVHRPADGNVDFDSSHGCDGNDGISVIDEVE